jgi:hypothetical protein
MSALPPESGLWPIALRCPLSANSGQQALEFYIQFTFGETRLVVQAFFKGNRQQPSQGGSALGHVAIVPPE